MTEDLYGRIIKCVNSGIERATREHLKLTSNDTELSYAPEYFITVNIIEELGVLKAGHLILEEPMGESTKPSKGRLPEELGTSKRYDIVVRDSKDSPYAVIEVKHRVYSVSARVIRDFKRISYAVNYEENNQNIFKMAIFAFYTVFDEDNTNQTEKKNIISTLYSDLEKELGKHKGNAVIDNRGLIDPTPYAYDENIVWGGGCFILSPP